MPRTTKAQLEATLDQYRAAVGSMLDMFTGWKLTEAHLRRRREFGLTYQLNQDGRDDAHKEFYERFGGIEPERYEAWRAYYAREFARRNELNRLVVEEGRNFHEGLKAQAMDQPKA